MSNQSSRQGPAGAAKLSAAFFAALLACLALVIGLSGPAHAQGSAGGELELRGYTRIGNSHAFSLRNTRTGESEWVWSDRPGEYFSIEGFDAENQMITVRHRNQIQTVFLQRSRIDHYDAPVTATLPSFEPPTPPPAPAGQPRTGAVGERRTMNIDSGDTDSGSVRETGTPENPPGPGGFLSGGFPGSGSGDGTIPPNQPSDPPAGGSDDLPDNQDDAPDDPFGPPPPPPDSPPPSYTPST